LESTFRYPALGWSANSTAFWRSVDFQSGRKSYAECKTGCWFPDSPNSWKAILAFQIIIQPIQINSQ